MSPASYTSLNGERRPLPTLPHDHDDYRHYEPNAAETSGRPAGATSRWLGFDRRVQRPAAMADARRVVAWLSRRTTTTTTKKPTRFVHRSTADHADSPPHAGRPLALHHSRRTAQPPPPDRKLTDTPYTNRRSVTPSPDRINHRASRKCQSPVPSTTHHNIPTPAPHHHTPPPPPSPPAHPLDQRTLYRDLVHDSTSPPQSPLRYAESREKHNLAQSGCKVGSAWRRQRATSRATTHRQRRRGQSRRRNSPPRPAGGAGKGQPFSSTSLPSFLLGTKETAMKKRAKGAAEAPLRATAVGPRSPQLAAIAPTRRSWTTAASWRNKASVTGLAQFVNSHSSWRIVVAASVRGTYRPRPSVSITTRSAQTY